MESTISTIAIFGANGHTGKLIVQTLVQANNLKCKVVAFVSPRSDFNLKDTEDIQVIVRKLDLTQITREELGNILGEARVETVIIALGGEILARQLMIQDAATIYGVNRNYPSDFVMPQIAWLPRGEAYIHPIWTIKIKLLQQAIRHPAIKSGRMTYTLIGCGEFYDAAEKPLMCVPVVWERWIHNKNAITLQVVGSPDRNGTYPGEQHGKARQAKYHPYGPDAGYLDPSSAPQELQRGDAFPVDFLMTLRYLQGQGMFWRPAGMRHNDLFPEVKTVSSDEYMKNLTSDGDK
ncbi:NAD(P)-binding protein [Penicillium angulare]|uniref:NAD(P)-binding protein n=1 Tax=Penicillium angulare TaxID=116970 RepID=A0A9W9EUB2_9EURO|nr:NAD(P)-binding protein [Penicillium angulare]